MKRMVRAAALAALLQLVPVIQAQPVLPPMTNSPPTPEQIAAMLAAQAAHEAAILDLVQQQYAPFANLGILTPVGYVASLDVLDAAQTDVLQMLAVQNGAVADADSAEVDAITATNGLTRKFVSEDGSVSELMAVRDGVPRYYCTLNANAAATVSTARIWPGGSTGFGLSGFNTVIAFRDEADVATNHIDSINNVEQVLVTNVTSGTYLVRVNHKGHLLDSAGQTNHQRLSLIISGNIPQPKPALQVGPPLVSHTNQVVNLKWPSVVGLRYRVVYNDNLGQTNWYYASGEISATKTNTYFWENCVTNSRFYRILEVQ